MVILVLRRNCTAANIAAVVDRLHGRGLAGRVMTIAGRSVVATDDDDGRFDFSDFKLDPVVEHLIPGAAPQPVVSPCGSTREVTFGHNHATIGGVRLGIIAGPCSVEDRTQLTETAHAVKQAGAIGLRGGAFKPRTNPNSFQGLGEKALKLLAEARQLTGLAVVTEVMSVDQVDLVAHYADVLQIGTRTMHNSSLLSAVGRTGKPVLLKRGWSATLEEFLYAAEYIINTGNPNVILCERGIRTFESYVRNTLALAVVPALKRCSPLPIIVDPSHGTGVADLVPPMSKAAIACGADGLLIEVHPDPPHALTDGDQSLNIPQFQALMSDLSSLAPVVGRTL